MKKISTLYKKNPSDLSRVTNVINPENAWVFTDEGVKATRKFDGTACAIISGRLYKRYDVKKGRAVPPNAITCQEPDEVTGHWPHWVKCDAMNPADQYHLAALNFSLSDGTYELCGPKIQGNPEGFKNYTLVEHGSVDLDMTNLKEYTFEMFKKYLTYTNIEGIVFHHPDGRMCKLRKPDFGIKR